MVARNYGFDLSQGLTPNAYFYYLGTFSIPLFFMMNGYFLLNKPQLDYGYVGKKIISMLVIVSFWTLLYWLVKWGGGSEVHNPLRNMLAALVQRGYFFQFWFFGSLMIIYVMLPPLHRWFQSYRLLLSSSLGFLLIGTLIQALNVVLPSSLVPLQGQVIQTFRLWTWLAYYLLGGLLGRSEFLQAIGGWVKSFAGLVGLGLLVLPVILFTICREVFHLPYAEYFYDSLLIKILVVPIFIIFMRLELPDRYRPIITLTSSLTTGIFILHVHLINLLSRFWDLTQFPNSLLAIPVVFLVSGLLSFLIAHLPFCKRLITF
ncbi:acyltransferase family protein [Streptococcus cuniculipharyngis]|uniref:Acyltransferase family protein n=1 Tax=Streptococcus cuniculipharyngis TaxID=1562651 RepID=A0A5C5SCV8_9STRE|nr:acyltransferase family protein [Streptococcus cuniculipharyngis]TWS97639.1 acyltransferase family protein [Streptococcus cuniculipharyngis]